MISHLYRFRPISAVLDNYEELAKQEIHFSTPEKLNAYTANGAVIGTCFGDAERGEAARKALAKAFPRRHLIMLKMDHIAEGGGGVHCLTQSNASYRTILGELTRRSAASGSAATNCPRRAKNSC